MTKIFLQGEILSSFETSFTDKETKKESITKKVQFLTIDENGKSKIIDIKLEENQDIKDLKQKVIVIIPISVSTMKDSFNIYYKQVGEIKISK